MSYKDIIEQAKLRKIEAKKLKDSELEKQRREAETKNAQLIAFFKEILIPELESAKEDLTDCGITAEIGNASSSQELRYTLRLPNHVPEFLVFFLRMRNDILANSIGYDIKFMQSNKDNFKSINCSKSEVQDLIKEFIEGSIK